MTNNSHRAVHYRIMAEWPHGTVEQVDEATNQEQAKYLVFEYRIAYGPQVSVWSETTNKT